MLTVFCPLTHEESSLLTMTIQRRKWDTASPIQTYRMPTTHLALAQMLRIRS